MEKFEKPLTWILVIGILGYLFMGNYGKTECSTEVKKEIRVEFDLPTPEQRPISILEEQLVYSLHATFLYSLTRKHVYGFDIGNQPELLVEIFVDSFFSSLENSINKLFEHENKLSGT